MLAYLYYLPQHQIREPKGHVTRTIADALGKKRSAVGVLLDGLERSGLVWREKTAARTFAAGLTEQGVQVATPEATPEPQETSSVSEAPAVAPITETQEATEELQQTIASLRRRITDLEIQLQNSREARSRAVAKKRTQSPQKRASVVSQRITDLVRDGNEKDGEIRELKVKVAELERQSAAAERRRAEKAEEQADALRRRVTEVEQAYANAMAEAATQSREVRTLRDELNRQRLLLQAA